MSSKILFICEGASTEKQIVESMCTHIFSSNADVTVRCVYGAEIYQLYKDIKAEGEPEFVDVFEILKRRDKDSLAQYSRDDFAEIYLFFDYDGHATGADDSKIFELLEFFDNETEKGKLLISYPMVEAIKHLNNLPFINTKVKCKEKINYKNLIQKECQHPYIDVTRYDTQIWREIISEHLKKMNYIVCDSYELPSKIVFQDIIFQHQYEKFISQDSTVSVLSAFPIFIHDYFGNAETLKIISD